MGAAYSNTIVDSSAQKIELPNDSIDNSEEQKGELSEEINAKEDHFTPKNEVNEAKCTPPDLSLTSTPFYIDEKEDPILDNPPQLLTDIIASLKPKENNTVFIISKDDILIGYTDTFEKAKKICKDTSKAQLFSHYSCSNDRIYQEINDTEDEDEFCVKIFSMHYNSIFSRDRLVNTYRIIKLDKMV